MSEQRCKTCRFGVADPEHIEGSAGELMQCRKRAPEICGALLPRALELMSKERRIDGPPRPWDEMHDAVREATEWPAVRSDDWCGEWAEVEPELPPAPPAMEWPTWEEVKARPELDVKNLGVRVRNAIDSLCQQVDERRDMTVQQAIEGEQRRWRGKPGFMRLRDVGKASFNLLCLAVEGWRRDRVGRRQP